MGLRAVAEKAELTSEGFTLLELDAGCEKETK